MPIILRPDTVYEADGTIAETVLVVRCTIRRNLDGTGTFEFASVRKVMDNGVPIGEHELPLLQSDFSAVSNVTFNVTMPDDSIAPLKGETILNGLENIYDYLSSQVIGIPMGPP